MPEHLTSHPGLHLGLVPLTGSSFASPEGGGAPERRTSNWFGLAAVALNDAERVAFRRSTAAICYAATALPGLDRRDFPSRYPGGIRAAVHPDPSSH